MKRSLITLGSVVILTAACSGGDGGGSPPAAPSGLTSIMMGGQPHLTWTDNSGNEDGFEIQRRTGTTGEFAEIATESFDIEQYHDVSAAPGTTYSYRVVAINGDGESDPSNEITVTTP